METPSDICHLARLPIDIQNMIATYLSFRTIESDADFIFRTEIKSHNVSDYHRDAQQYRRPHGFFSGDSPDSLKEVFLDQSDTHRSRVVGADRVPRKGSKPVSLDAVAQLIDEEKEYHQTVDVTISSDGQWFGRLAQKKVEFSRGFVWQFLSLVGVEEGNRAQITVIHIPNATGLSEPQITVGHIPSGTKRDFAIPILLKSVIFLDFNKQGTKIITHGVCYDKEERTSFMWNLVTEEEHAAKSKKTLAEYLKQKGICKDLKNSLQ